LRLQPGLIEAEIVLARLDANSRDFGALRTKVAALLGRPDLAFENRASLLILLGDALDAEGDYPGAFEAYRAGKAQLGRMYVKNHGAPSEGAFATAQRVAAGLIEVPSRPPLPAPPASDEAGPKRHVFLLGFPRSGTTLLEQVLASRPDAVDLEERPSFGAVEPTFFSDEGGLERLASLAEAALGELRKDYWKTVRDFGVEPAGKLFIDKHPFSTLRLPLIAALFPQAKVLFAVRDPRDVVLSCFRRNFHMSATTARFASLEGAARFYDTVMAAGMRYRERHDFDLREVRYEALVTDFDAEARALCDFLDLEWRHDMGAFAERARARLVRSISAPQVARGLYADAVGYWRNYRDQLAPVLPILAPWVERFGYPEQ
jgi:hypothetical protein